MSRQRAADGWSETLLRSWDEQQAGFLPRREERFAVLAEVVRGVCGAAPRVLDLGCGPGSTSDRLLRALPEASCVAVDADPLLLQLGRSALADVQERLEFVDADLRDPDWIAALPSGPFDAVVSTTALHWLDAGSLHRLYGSVHGLLRPGGVLLNGDGLAYAPGQPTLARLARERAAADEAVSAATGVLGWREWWELALASPELAGTVGERAAREQAGRARHGPRVGSASLALHRAALLDAGFFEVDTVWQHFDDRILLAVKARP